MQTKRVLRRAEILTTFVSVTLGLCEPAASETPKTPPPSTATATSPAVASAPAMTLAEAQKVLSTARKYVAHPVASRPGDRPAQGRAASPDFEMETPPPPPRPEAKPASPNPSYVWVPGHYMPVKGGWRWVGGEWAVPATPSSVWIAASYDAKEKKWSPGYWQPDRPSAPDPEGSPKDSVLPLSPKY